MSDIDIIKRACFFLKESEVVVDRIARSDKKGIDDVIELKNFIDEAEDILRVITGTIGEQGRSELMDRDEFNRRARAFNLEDPSKILEIGILGLEMLESYIKPAIAVCKDLSIKVKTSVVQEMMELVLRIDEKVQARIIEEATNLKRGNLTNVDELLRLINEEERLFEEISGFLAEIKEGAIRVKFRKALIDRILEGSKLLNLKVLGFQFEESTHVIATAIVCLYRFITANLS